MCFTDERNLVNHFNESLPQVTSDESTNASSTRKGDCKKIKAKRRRAKKAQSRPGPKLPLSAYNYFFKSEREVLLESLPVRSEGKPRRSHGKIGFADMARVIGARWKSLTPEEKLKFDSIAAEDKARYKREMKAYKSSRTNSSTKSEQEIQVQQTAVSPEPAPKSPPQFNEKIRGVASVLSEDNVLLPMRQCQDAFIARVALPPISSFTSQPGFINRTHDAPLSPLEDPRLEQMLQSQYSRTVPVEARPMSIYPVPIDPFEMDVDDLGDFEPYDIQDIGFQNNMERLAQQLGNDMMDQFIRAFR